MSSVRWLVTVVLFLLLVGPEKGQIAAYAQPVMSMAPGLSVEKINTEGQMLELTFRNGYGKAITAFRLVIDDLTITREFVSSELGYSILPGATDRVIHPRGADTLPQAIRIVAVVFDDGTFDGDRKAVTEIIDLRRGKDMQLEKVTSILASYLESREGEIPSALDELKARIQSLETSHENSWVESGLRSVKEDVLRQLARIEHARQNGATFSMRERLTDLLKWSGEVSFRLKGTRSLR